MKIEKSRNCVEQVESNKTYLERKKLKIKMPILLKISQHNLVVQI